MVELSIPNRMKEHTGVNAAGCALFSTATVLVSAIWPHLFTFNSKLKVQQTAYQTRSTRLALLQMVMMGMALEILWYCNQTKQPTTRQGYRMASSSWSLRTATKFYKFGNLRNIFALFGTFSDYSFELFELYVSHFTVDHSGLCWSWLQGLLCVTPFLIYISSAILMEAMLGVWVLISSVPSFADDIFLQSKILFF